MTKKKQAERGLGDGARGDVEHPDSREEIKPQPGLQDAPELNDTEESKHA